jgi:chemotaxis protein MotB
MKRNYSMLVAGVVIFVFAVTTSGCSIVFQKGRRVDVEKISRLKSELSEMERAKAQLENRLREEINDSEVNVEMLQKGLVITFVAEVLFDSGKAELRKSSLPKLAKVSKVLNTTVKGHSIGIEGHTDNVPIKYSGWKSNWELSTARALSVLHYMIDNHNINPQRLSATGYGEQRPIASNKTEKGRQQNRRVEIVVIPKTIKKER